MIGFRISGCVCTKSSNRNEESFTGLIQLLSDKMTTILSSTGLLAYYTRAIFLNVSIVEEMVGR